VSSNNLTNALAGYVSKTDDNAVSANNTFTGINTFNAYPMPPSVLATPQVGAGCSFYWNTIDGSGATDILCNGNGGLGGLNIWSCNQTTNPPSLTATFRPTSSNINGTLNITNPTNPAFTVGLESDAPQTLNVIGDLTCRNFQADGATIGALTATGTTTLGTATCPTVTVDDKYPTTDIVNATSLINYVNSQTATSQYFVGQLINGLFPSNSPELLASGFLFCNGDPLDYTNPAYTALYNVIGINYGTSGGTTFWLPDFRGRMALGGNIEQGFGVPVPQFLDQDTTRNEQYNGVYGGYVGTSDFPSHFHTITDPGHNHSANINWSKSNNANDNQNLKFNSQDGAQQAFVSNTSFTGITQTNITGSSGSIGVMNPYCATNFFIYAGN
jgi:microcystin-dependent protein